MMLDRGKLVVYVVLIDCLWFDFKILIFLILLRGFFEYKVIDIFSVIVNKLRFFFCYL